MTKKNDTVLMKNRQKGIFHIAKTVFEKLKDEGIKTTLEKIAKNIGYKLKGIDFDAHELTSLNIKSDNLKYATICGSSSENTVNHVLNTLLDFEKNITKGKFIDIGSGKGKLLSHAYNCGFKKLIGVEFSKKLCEISQKNLSILGIKDVKILHMDAVDFVFPRDTKVIYFLNPFSDKVFKKVLSNILTERKKFIYDIYVVYRAPIFNDVFLKFKDFKHIKSDLFNGDLTEFYLLKRAGK